jgi:type II secretory pathway component PulF
MSSSSSRSDALAVLPAIVVHGILWTGFLVLLVRVVPRFKRIFADFQMKLPAATEVAIDLSDWMADYWYLQALALPVALALDGGIAYWLYFNRETRWLYWLWFTSIAIVPVCVSCSLLVALLEPLIELMDALAR